MKHFYNVHKNTYKSLKVIYINFCLSSKMKYIMCKELTLNILLCRILLVNKGSPLKMYSSLNFFFNVLGFKSRKMLISTNVFKFETFAGEADVLFETSILGCVKTSTKNVFYT